MVWIEASCLFWKLLSIHENRFTHRKRTQINVYCFWNFNNHELTSTTNNFVKKIDSKWIRKGIPWKPYWLDRINLIDPKTQLVVLEIMKFPMKTPFNGLIFHSSYCPDNKYLYFQSFFHRLFVSIDDMKWLWHTVKGFSLRIVPEFNWYVSIILPVHSIYHS